MRSGGFEGCRCCGRLAPSMWLIEMLCGDCYSLFYSWMQQQPQDPLLVAWEDRAVHVFDFRKPATNVLFDAWLEAGRP